MDTKLRASIAKKIENYLSGLISNNEMTEYVNRILQNYSGLQSNLYHLINDEDIRSRDLDYRAFQTNEAQKLINGLLKGVDIKTLSNIDFLSISDIENVEV